MDRYSSLYPCLAKLQVTRAFAIISALIGLGGKVYTYMLDNNAAKTVSEENDRSPFSLFI